MSNSTSIVSADPKVLSAAVDLLAAHNAKCAREASDYTAKLLALARNHPLEFAKVIEDAAPQEIMHSSVMVLFDSHGHISGYREFAWPFFSDHEDPDLRSYIGEKSSERVAACQKRSR